MTLHELHNGDVFVHANDRRKNKLRYVVYGNPSFNIRHGSPVRNCLDNGKVVSKSCRLEVVKLGTSVHVEKIKAMFDAPVKIIL